MRLLVRWTSSGSYHSVLRRTRWRTGAGQGAPGEEPSTSSAFWPPFSALGFSCSANPLERGNVSPFRKPTVPPRKAALSGSGSVSRHEEEPPPDGAPGHSSLRDALATITNLDSSALNAPGLWATARERRQLGSRHPTALRVLAGAGPTGREQSPQSAPQGKAPGTTSLTGEGQRISRWEDLWSFLPCGEWLGSGLRLHHLLLSLANLAHAHMVLSQQRQGIWPVPTIPSAQCCPDSLLILPLCCVSTS